MNLTLKDEKKEIIDRITVNNIPDNEDQDSAYNYAEKLFNKHIELTERLNDG